MIMAQEADALKAHPLLPHAQAIEDFVRTAARQGTPAHEAERTLFRMVLQLGYRALGLFLALQGSGDLGPAVELSDGTPARRLDEPHVRDYRTVFGHFQLSRTCYGSREGQKIALVPLDARLQLPAGDCSYLLQEWDQLLAVEHAFGRVADTLEQVLGLKQSVDTLEGMNRDMAEHVEAFREAKPRPKAKEEGAVFVAGGDGKGIVMRRREQPKPKGRQPGRQPRPGHRTKGQKANQKRMAIVGALYSIDRHRRTPEEVLAALFRDPPAVKPAPGEVRRPAPKHKHLWASLTHQRDGREVPGMEAVFSWLGEGLRRRNPGQAKETVCLMDGQEALWEARREHLPGQNVVEVLDLLHVTPRLWQAAHLWHKEGSAEAEAFARQHVLRVLRGEVEAVVRDFRERGSAGPLSAAKRKRLEGLCGYLEKNKGRMRYAAYLAQGYPIASGVLEGACRHYVKDRMERAGMHWTKEGAQAMLDVRSVHLNDDWEAFQHFRIERETERLYPHRQLLDQVEWALAT